MDKTSAVDVGYVCVAGGLYEHIRSFNMPWHNFEINKQMFKLAVSVLQNIEGSSLKSLPPNIYIFTLASWFNDT